MANGDDELDALRRRAKRDLDDPFKLNCSTEDEIERFSEMKDARDLIIHNSGIVNKIYLDKAGKKARYQAGDKVVIDPPYIDDCWSLAKKLVDAVSTVAKARLSKDPSRR